MKGIHTYEVSMRWTGNLGEGTRTHRGFSRDHVVQCEGKPDLAGTADPAFRGDPCRWNPEELLVAALSQCHMLWYLHLAATEGIVVTAYEDTPTGTMAENPDGSGQFTEVVLRPAVAVTDPAMRERAHDLHRDAHAMCFIARSVSFPIHHVPTTIIGTAGRGD